LIVDDRWPVRRAVPGLAGDRIEMGGTGAGDRSGIGGLSPADRVHNLTGDNSWSMAWDSTDAQKRSVSTVWTYSRPLWAKASPAIESRSWPVRLAAPDASMQSPMVPLRRGWHGAARRGAR
jgi:hypothetical protein